MVPRNSRLTIDHASLSRRSTVPAPTTGGAFVEAMTPVVRAHRARPAHTAVARISFHAAEPSTLRGQTEFPRWGTKKTFKSQVICPHNRTAVLKRVHTHWSINPFRTAVPFWEKSTWNLSGLSPKRDCGPKRVNSGYR